MNAVPQLPQAGMAASAGLGTPQVPPDVNRAADVHALWKAAFERRQAAEDAFIAGAMRMALQTHELDACDAPSAERSVPDVTGNAQSRTEAASRAAAAAMQPAAPESVNVFVQGKAVAIVVRDVSLSLEEALHCGFETARELTGRSAALQHLTLNGRAIYRQPSDDGGCRFPLQVESSMSVWTFAC